MGPVTIFDKSVLQALNYYEAMWLDNFYLVNITPLFFAESLADLEKSVADGRSPENIVGSIASRTPTMGSVSNVHHLQLCQQNLFGFQIAMDGRPVVGGAEPISVDGKQGFRLDTSPEEEALLRWKKNQFLTVERQFAKRWREDLKSIDLQKYKDLFKKMWKGNSNPKNLSTAKAIAERIVSEPNSRHALLLLALEWFEIPKEKWLIIGERWHRAGQPSLYDFAPYAAYVLSVDFFFHLAIAAHLIGHERASHSIDIAYLYYLPFCQIFTSSDKLHRNTAPLFLHSNQEFVWGGELKEDLKRIDAHFSALPEEVRAQGLMRIAKRPPVEGDFLTSRLWDKFLLPSWRTVTDSLPKLSEEQNEKLLAEIKRFTDAPSQEFPKEGLPEEDINSFSIKRQIPVNRGKWRILPEDFESKKSKK